MRLDEFYKIADAVAPKALSDEFCTKYNAYDNSGILIDCDEEIKKVLFSLDLSTEVIGKAIEEKANLIVTHHPAIYGKISNIRMDDKTTLGAKLVYCLRNGISVISMHLNLDMAIGGIDECLEEGIRYSAGTVYRLGESKLMHEISQGGYGRAYDVSPVSLSALVQNMRETFNTERIIFYGNKNSQVRRIASFCGAGGDEGSILFAFEQNADTVVSADFKHHVITYALEKGLNVIALTHYASENYGFKNYYEKIRRQTEIPCVYYTDERLL